MLTRELGREPTMEELAEAAGLEHEEIVLALEANRGGGVHLSAGL